MNIKEHRFMLRTSLIETLYFIDKYLINEHQLKRDDSNYVGYLVLFQEESEPYRIAFNLLKSELAESILKKFGYLMYFQDEKDIIVKDIF